MFAAQNFFMDRNSIIGLVIIGFIIIGYSIFTQPDEEERAALRQRHDSIAAVLKVEEQKKEMELALQKAADVDSVLSTSLTDSAKQEINKQELGDFASSASGTEEFFTLENELIKVTLTNKGGKIKNVELKKYKTFDDKAVLLFGFRFV